MQIIAQKIFFLMTVSRNFLEAVSEAEMDKVILGMGKIGTFHPNPMTGFV